MVETEPEVVSSTTATAQLRGPPPAARSALRRRGRGHPRFLRPPGPSPLPQPPGHAPRAA